MNIYRRALAGTAIVAAALLTTGCYELHIVADVDAAGLITGEAIIGILMAMPIAYTSNPDVLAVAEAWRPGQWAGLAVLSAIGYWLYRVATRHAPSG